MKVRPVSIVIDAKQYRPGLEDGFVTRYQDEDDPNSTWGIPGSDGEIPIEIPFIKNKDGQKKLISLGDWILTRPNKTRSIISNKDFRRLFEEVEGDAIEFHRNERNPVVTDEIIKLFRRGIEINKNDREQTMK